MSAAYGNLLLRLHRWASRQSENFTTEAFVHLLLHLIEFEPEIAVFILRKLTKQKLIVNTQTIKRVSINTQVTTEQGKPDIEIKTSDFLIYIEVKVGSGFGNKQISRYREELNKSSFPNKLLITLTRYPISYNTNNQEDLPNVAFRWHHVVDWFENINFKFENSKLLVNQFVTFLKKRGIAMDNVSWELVSGIRSFRSCLDMVGEALASMKVSVYRSSAAWDWYGYYIEDKKFFIGIYLNNPGFLTINTEVALARKEFEDVPVGRLENGGWRNELDLESEEIHFFARSKASQIQCIEKFIKESIDYARTIVK